MKQKKMPVAALRMQLRLVSQPVYIDSCHLLIVNTVNEFEQS